MTDPERGILPRNVHPMVARLVARPEGGVDLAMYQALHTTITLDQALDLVEIDDVSRSVRAAAQRNAARLSARVAEMNGRT